MDILYQDNRIAVCLKPPGVLSTDEPGGMPSLLRAALGTDCVRTVHRLDAAVGGVMVFARSRMAASILSEQIREHRFQKEYLAVICIAVVILIIIGVVLRLLPFQTVHCQDYHVHPVFLA